MSAVLRRFAEVARSRPLVSAVSVAAVVAASAVLIAGVENSFRAPHTPASPATESKPEQFKIGAVMSLTGKFKKQGRAMLQGYRLAVDAVNTRQPIRTATAELELTLVVFDDESDPQRAAAVTRALLADDEVRILLAPYSSLLAGPAAAVANARKVPVVVAVGSTAGLQSVTGDNVYVMQTPPSRHLAGAALLLVNQLAKEEKVPENFNVVLVAAADLHSQEVVAGVSRILHAASAGILTAVTLIGAGLPLSEDAVNSITEADALFVAGFAHGAELVVNILIRNETWPSLLAMTHCDLANLSNGVKNSAEGALCALHWQADANFSGNKTLTKSAFVSKYRLMRREPPPHQSAAAAAAVLVIADAARDFSKRSDGNLADILSASSLATFYGNVNFNKNGANDAKPMVLSQIQDMRLVPVYPENWALAKYVPKPAKKKEKSKKSGKKAKKKK